MNNLMRRIIVLNTKGGCGKTTIATNLASAYAAAGYKTALIDQDPQGSSMQWLRSRPVDLPAIQGVVMHEANRVPLAGAWQLRVPRDTQRVVVDTPAGVRGLDLVGRITAQDCLLIPIQPSAMDIRASSDFIRDLLLIAKLRPQDRRMAIIGNRTKPKSQAFQSLLNFLQSTQIPVLVHLRDSQNYVTAAEQGMGVCELPPLQSRLERANWKAVFDWLETDAPPVTLPAIKPAVMPATASPVRAPFKPVPAFLTKSWEPEQPETAPKLTPKDLN